MANLIPYQTEMNEISVLRAIIDAKPPADVASLDLPESIIWILDNCLNRIPEARPPMFRCVEVLDTQGLDPPFKLYLKRSIGGTHDDRVPAHFMTSGPGWWAIHRPHVFTWDSLISFADWSVR